METRGHPMSSERDIVERLRGRMVYRLVGPENVVPDQDCADAADEIESLRKERDEAKAACRAMVREIETLRRFARTCDIQAAEADLTRSIGS